MQPADRQQMGKAATPHRLRIRFGNRALIAGRQRHRNPRRCARHLFADMIEQPRPQRWPLARLLHHLDRRQRPPGRPDPLEIGASREIERPRHARRRGRHQPRTKAQHRPLAQPFGHVRLRDIHPDRRGQSRRLDRPQAHPHHLLRRQLGHRRHRARHLYEYGTRQRRLTQPCRLAPDQQATDAGEQPARHQHVPQSRAHRQQ